MEVARRWVADDRHDATVNSELGDGTTRNAAVDEVGVRAPYGNVPDEGAERVDGDAAVGDHNDNSLVHPALDICEGGDEALGSVACGIPPPADKRNPQTLVAIRRGTPPD